ncbi:SDR family NAD(P)-dependent oxidoreductase [Hyphomonas sp. ND6WE1B]|uniref:SDR family NAD(P)-dependent oxidoreductase n=1 Tax=Hyphomonas sp. ND6WE1B TaxID=1848191 RepID=UPI0008076685|nr:SDR family NAD(P)-dependent oxidoreductase [Hyphomonas sp. ND6WE1B]
MSTWLITGAGNGLGRTIAEVVLGAGHQVVATARKPSQLDSLVETFGRAIAVAELDVTDEEACAAAIEFSATTFGSIDVVVNNAGFGDVRPFEQTPSEDFRNLVETCFYGVVNMTRHVLPLMRAQRSGHIFQISSIGGRVAFAGNASYHAAKWAVGGFSEAVAQAAAPFGVVVTAIEPGGMRTGFGATATREQVDLLEEYEPSVGHVMKMLDQNWGRESGDPVKVAKVLLALAEAPGLPAHIVLGRVGLETVRAVETERARVRDLWQPVGDWIDFEADGALPALPDWQLPGTPKWVD